MNEELEFCKIQVEDDTIYGIIIPNSYIDYETDYCTEVSIYIVYCQNRLSKYYTESAGDDIIKESCETMVDYIVIPKYDEILAIKDKEYHDNPSKENTFDNVRGDDEWDDSYLVEDFDGWDD